MELNPFEAPGEWNQQDTEAEEPLHYGRIERRRPNADSHPAAAAAWLEAHREEIIECDRHNGRARLTMKSCAERYRRAVSRWVDSLAMHEHNKQPLRLSFATCAACPVGAYNAAAMRARR
jgi:hypothetical protein